MEDPLPLLRAGVGTIYRHFPDKAQLDILIRGIATRPDEEPALSAPALALDRVDRIMFNVNRPR